MTAQHAPSAPPDRPPGRPADHHAEHGRGVAYGLGAYLIWGFVPAYFKLLAGVPPIEIVAHRIIWSVVLLLGILAAMRKLDTLRAVFADRRLRAWLALSSVLIAANWLFYIWAVVNNHLIATSLGYFLNPLVNVALGVAILGERLNRAQKLAVAVAMIGVAVAAAGALSQLWIALALAASFACYGLARKIAAVGALEGLTAETIILAPLSLLWLWWQSGHGGLGFGVQRSTDALLIASSIVTSAPLLLFGAATRRLPFATVGLLQYVGPSITFLLGVFVYHEALRPAMLIAFLFIWAALVIFTLDMVRGWRATRA